MYFSCLVEYSVIENNFQMVVFSKERILLLIIEEEAVYVCELCLKHGKGVESIVAENGEQQDILPQVELKTISSDTILSPQLHGGQGARPPRKLRILCLHGFWQNASGFKGRTASLAKKLKSIAERIFVDAPHELPFIYQPVVSELECSDESSFSSQLFLPPTETCWGQFAWLIASDSEGRRVTDWKKADSPFDPLQYQQQTEGFNISLSYLKTVFSQDGPFDGILGFSQGAAMAALLCAQKGRLKGDIDFRYAILCSGFALPLAEIKRGSINHPSLHIFGSVPGKDRQIENKTSRELASLFEDGCSVIIEHDCDHIIPTRSPYIDEIKGFLQRFL